MSVILLPKTHIDALVTAGLTYGAERGRPLVWGGPAQTLTTDTADAVGEMLTTANEAAYTLRYGPEPGVGETTYSFERLPGTPNPVDVLAMIDGYTYQGCDKGSEAHRFCEALRASVADDLPEWFDKNASRCFLVRRRDAFTRATR